MVPCYLRMGYILRLHTQAVCLLCTQWNGMAQAFGCGQLLGTAADPVRTWHRHKMSVAAAVDVALHKEVLRQ